MAKRIISLDILRGIAIWSMTLFHLLENVYDYTAENSISPEDLGRDGISIVFGLTIGILGYWRPFFLMISSTVTMYTIDKSIRNGKDRKAILQKQIFFGLIIYFLGILRESVFSHYGLIGHYLEGDFEFQTSIFDFDTLNIIGVSVIFMAIIHYFLTKNNGVTKNIRNAAVYGILAILIICFTPLAHFLVDQQFNGDFLAIQNAPTNFWGILPRLFYSAIVGMPEPIFPYMATTFIGCVIGIILNMKEPPTNFIKYGFIIANLLTALGILIFAFSGIEMTLNFPILKPLWFYIFNLGTQIWTLIFAIWVGEFKRSTNRKRWIKNTKFLRRWGMISLTIYFLEIIITIPLRFILTFLFKGLGVNFISRNKASLEWTLFYTIIGLIYWDIIVRIWEKKKKFKGSLEWLLIKVGQLTIGMKYNDDDPLDIEGVLYNFKHVTVNRTKFKEGIDRYSNEKQFYHHNMYIIIFGCLSSLILVFSSLYIIISGFKLILLLYLYIPYGFLMLYLSLKDFRTPLSLYIEKNIPKIKIESKDHSENEI